MALADAIEAPDTLFEQVRIQRQIPQDHIVRKLEIAAFRADLRAQQQTRAAGLGKMRSIAVALYHGQGFMEPRQLHAAARA